MSVVYVTQSKLQEIREELKRPKRPAAPAIIPKYNDLPSDWKASNHYHFYGWAVTNEMLQNYVSSINMPNHANDNDFGIVTSALFYMRLNIGFKDLYHVAGKADDEAARKGRVKQRDGRVYLDLVAIGCTRSKRLFWRRPTPDQLQQLIQILGEEPRWFEDIHTKDEFDPEIID